MPRGRIRSTLPAALALTALALMVPTAATAQSTTRTVCPGTFQVLHNDSVGALRLSAGAYQLTVANPARLSCAAAARDLTEFLQDYDGKVRRPWTVNARQSSFQRGTDAQIAFSVARTGSAGGGGGGGGENGGNTNPTSNSCPGYFRVLHNDHIGSLSVPKDAYRINVLNSGSLSCARAASLLTQFLQDFNGRLPAPWRLNNNTATFTRGAGSTVGFRIKPATGPEPTPSKGGRFPAKGQSGECPGTFRVLSNDTIARVPFPAGPYVTFTYRGTGVNCAQASQLFRTFLGGQRVPTGYSLSPANGVFSKGNKPVFRVKPASPRGNTAR